MATRLIVMLVDGQHNPSMWTTRLPTNFTRQLLSFSKELGQSPTEYLSKELLNHLGILIEEITPYQDERPGAPAIGQGGCPLDTDGEGNCPVHPSGCPI